MEKMGIIAEQPAMIEILMMLIKRVQGKSLGLISKLRLKTLESLLQFFYSF